MKITLIEPRGFCFGVCRALKMLDNIQHRPVYVLHEIVHNQVVVNAYRQKGFIFVDELGSVPNGSTVVFSAHGVSKQVEQQAQEKNLTIIDTTCPFVKKVHEWMQKLEQQKRTIVLIGKKNHAEVIGSVGQVNEPDKVLIVSNKEDVDALPALGAVGIATQTTLSEEDTKNIIEALQRKYPDCLIQSGICRATTERQEALRQACQEHDTILVVGDKKSSNCMRLVEIAKSNGCQTYLIENPQDVLNLPLGQSIAITAAASAPEDIVQKTLCLLQSNWH